MKEIDSKFRTIEEIKKIVSNFKGSVWYFFDPFDLKDEFYTDHLDGDKYLIISLLKDREGPALYFTATEEKDDINWMANTDSFMADGGKIYRREDEDGNETYWCSWQGKKGDTEGLGDYIEFDTDKSFNGDFVYAWAKGSVADLSKLLKEIEG